MKCWILHQVYRMMGTFSMQNIRFSYLNANLFNKWRNQIISLLALITTEYSVTVVDRVTDINIL